MHVPFGTPVRYMSNPPASGTHWPAPHPWGNFPESIPREWWVHNLEHGGIVFLFQCPGTEPDDAGAPPDGGFPWACPAETDVLRSLHDELPLDKFGEVRVLVTGDPLAPHAVSAVAWDWLYQSDTVDRAALACFRDARYGQGPEDAP
jgi:hypothetical protein